MQDADRRPPSRQARIERVEILPMGMVNAHLIISGHAAILVDAGLPGTERRVQAALHAHGLGWSDLRLIVVTHAHIDHAGNAVAIRRLSGAPVCGHSADLPYFLNERRMCFCPSGVFGRAFFLTGLIQRTYEPFTPELLLRDGQTLDLAPYGVAGIVRHCGGHTPGSLSVELDGGDALVGDLVASGVMLGGIVLKGRAKSPPFEEDPPRIGAELLTIAGVGHRTFHLGHGGPLPADEVRRHARTLLHKTPGRPL